MRLQARHLSLSLLHGFSFFTGLLEVKTSTSVSLLLSLFSRWQVLKNFTNSLESLQMRMKKQERWTWNISNQIKHGADSVTWKWSQTAANCLSSFYANLMDEIFSQLLFLTARGCFFVDFGCCKGITGRETTGITVHNTVLQVLPQVTRKCYWCHVRFMWRWR